VSSLLNYINDYFIRLDLISFWICLINLIISILSNATFSYSPIFLTDSSIFADSDYISKSVPMNSLELLNS
jgi:hypothetical protein